MATTRTERAAIAAACALLIGGCDSQTAEQRPEPANVAAAATASPSFPPARPLVPFVKDTDVDCDWNMHAKGKEKWIRGGIGKGDEDPMIQLVDRAFTGWSDSEQHRIEVSVGDPERRLAVNAWAGSGDAQMPGSASFYMDAEMRKLIGGATSLQIWKDGKAVFNSMLAGTPSVAELDACVRPPTDPAHTDEE